MTAVGDVILSGRSGVGASLAVEAGEILAVIGTVEDSLYSLSLTPLEREEESKEEKVEENQEEKERVSACASTAGLEGNMWSLLCSLLVVAYRREL